jgi:hypothetical protein
MVYILNLFIFATTKNNTKHHITNQDKIKNIPSTKFKVLFLEKFGLHYKLINNTKNLSWKRKTSHNKRAWS